MEEALGYTWDQSAIPRDIPSFSVERAMWRLQLGVGLGTRGRYMPPRTEPSGENLRRIYARGVQFIEVELDYSFEQAIAYFLFAALQQFYFDGNKRTARYMMNGHLMSHGFDAISVPAARRHEFNAGMVEFFTAKDGTGMFRFLVSCRTEADQGVLPGQRLNRERGIGHAGSWPRRARLVTGSQVSGLPDREASTRSRNPSTASHSSFSGSRP
jgi:hypothetical protein